MNAFKEYIMALLGFMATLLLTLVGSLGVHLDDKQTFIVFSTGTVVSLALALIEQRLTADQRDLRANIAAELTSKLDLFRLLDQISDPELKEQVYSLARSLSAGEVPAHIAAIRIPTLYDQATKSVYGSNVSLTLEKLYRWDESPRFRSIVETSSRRYIDGVICTRTFVLRRSEVMPSPTQWDARSVAILNAQAKAHIQVHIIWIEDLETDVVRPRRNLERDFTIFDGEEAVDTSDFQVIYRRPSAKLQELLETQSEQLKYSTPLDRLLTPNP